MLFALLCLVVTDKAAATEQHGFVSSCRQLHVEPVNRVRESFPEPDPYLLRQRDS